MKISTRNPLALLKDGHNFSDPFFPFIKFWENFRIYNRVCAWWNTLGILNLGFAYAATHPTKKPVLIAQRHSLHMMILSIEKNLDDVVVILMNSLNPWFYFLYFTNISIARVFVSSHFGMWAVTSTIASEIQDTWLHVSMHETNIFSFSPLHLNMKCTIKERWLPIPHCDLYHLSYNNMVTWAWE